MVRLNKYWVLVIVVLVVIITIGGTVFWSRYSNSQPIEIYTTSEPELLSTIYIGGAVNNPGLYPIKTQDNLQDIIQAVGGITSTADLSSLTIYIPQIEEGIQPQKINLNRAEAWLLEALPGIGEVKAQAIIDYRHQNGLFHNINELTRVDGIGFIIYEQIKHLITVAN